jgi:Fe-S cluster assembly protein SufD
MTTENVLEAPVTGLVSGYNEETLARLTDAEGVPLVAAKRETAFRRYADRPRPTGFDEMWRRTDPGQFPFDTAVPLPLLTPGEDTGDSSHDEAFDVVVAVNDRHYCIHDRGGALAEGKVVVASLGEAAARHPEWVREFLLGRDFPDSADDKFTALNAAFWNFGLLIVIPAGTVLEKGILIRHVHAEEGACVLPRLVVRGEGDAQATIVERFQSDDATNLLVAAAKEIYLDEAARIKWLTVQEWGRNTAHFSSDMAWVARDGLMDWITLNFGAGVAKMNFGCDVEGEGANAELDGLFFADDDQHLDQTTLQIHSAPHTYSRLLYKGAVRDEAHSVYRGVIQARPGAIKVDAYQTNNNLVLSDGARADTIPGLLIDADDLKCSHGATIGNLDEEQVFYLQSRGLSEEQARKILITGFFDEVADRIPYEFVRDRVHHVIAQRSMTDEEDED